MKVLLIEDDHMLGQAIKDSLTRKAFDVAWCQDGQQALALITQDTWKIIILDLGLPHISGSRLLTYARKANKKTPILILTAKDGIKDKVSHLNDGADDYMVKPFDLNELIARIHVLIRRSFGHQDSQLTCQGLSLDLVSHKVTYKGTEVQLHKMEYAILKELMLNKGRVISREKLEQSYDLGKHVSSNAIEVHIHHIRSKLSSQIIKTIRGVGYIIEKEA